MIEDLTYHRFTCDNCGAIGKEAKYTVGEKVAAEISLTEQAIADGWIISDDTDLCPECSSDNTIEEQEKP